MDLLRHLRFFVAIAEERQFGHAARRIGISQPPLSRGLQRLESELGVRLFDRGPHGVDLTDAGVALLPHAHRLLRAEQRMREAAETTSAGRSGLRLGVDPSLPPSLSARLAAAGSAALDGGVTLHTAPTTALVDAVAAGRLDAGVVVHPTVLGTLAGADVVRLPTALLVPERPEPQQEPSLRAVVQVPLAVPPRDHHPAAHDLLVDTLDEHGVAAGTAVVPDDRAALALVATGQACLLTADPTLDAPGVRRVPVGDVLPLRLRVVMPPRPAAHLPAGLAQALTTVLREAADELRG